MKKQLLITSLLLAMAFQMKAQRPDFSPQCKEAMKKLSYLTGDWSGKATMRNQGGETVIDQTEHIEWELDSMILSIEGTGFQSGAVKFHAFAVVNYDPFSQQYKFKSFVKEGYSTEAYFKILSENKFEWGFDIPTGGKSKYTITLDPKKGTWFEVGEFSRDGNTWMKFIELNLNKE